MKSDCVEDDEFVEKRRDLVGEGETRQVMSRRGDYQFATDVVVRAMFGKRSESEGLLRSGGTHQRVHVWSRLTLSPAVATARP